MKKILSSCSSLVILACAGVAIAGGPQIMPVEPNFFNGFSVGANLSFHHTAFDVDNTVGANVFLPTQFNNVGLTDVNTTAYNYYSIDTDASGSDLNGYAGAQLNFGHVINNRWYIGGSLFGEIGDASDVVTAATDTQDFTFRDVPDTTANLVGTTTSNVKVQNGLGVALKPGFLIDDHILAYAKIGAEWSRITIDTDFTGTFEAIQSADPVQTVQDPLQASASGDDYKTGLVLGGGLEYAVTPVFSVFGEYTFTNYGSVSASGTPVKLNMSIIDSKTGKVENFDYGSLEVAQANTNAKVSAVTMGLNYRLPWF